MNDQQLNVAAVRNPEPVLIDLSSMRVVDVNGSEAETFLQGQFCNDVMLVKASTEALAGSAILNGYCTPKGRLLALPVLIGTAEGYRLIVPAALEESLLKRLRMFVMRADVVFTPRPELKLLGMQGPAESWANHIPESVGLSADRMGVCGDHDIQTLRWFDGVGGQHRWLLVLPDQMSQTFSDAALGENGVATAAPVDQWTLGNIHAGVPEIGIETTDTFIPQMLNLQQVGGLSFTKGCYPGQEIVARMQYLGKLKRYMVHMTLPADAKSPDSGDSIATAASDTAAEVVSAIDTGEGVHMLAVVRTGLDLSTLAVDGYACTPVDLPYELPDPSTGKE